MCVISRKSVKSILFLFRKSKEVHRFQHNACKIVKPQNARKLRQHLLQCTTLLNGPLSCNLVVD